MAIIWRILRWLAVTVWFGAWACGISYLLLSDTIIDPRDPFPEWMSNLGCGMLVLGWLGLSVYYAINDDFPESW
ncbi:MAG: hypothetical protein JJE13_04315 [Thermoleophilia bacterium]|nr:hypothetical protein [Thermoleophilia bacterium]